MPGGWAAEGRAVVYCLIPGELAPKLHDVLRRHFRDDAGLEVIVERRRGDRREVSDRRTSDIEPPGGSERRRVRGAAGRRVEERRVPLKPVEPRALPRQARRYADRLTFVERVEPSSERAEDADTARVVARIQAGDSEAFSILYTRFFDRVYSYLRVILDDRHEAEDATQEVFVKLLETIPAYERRRQPFKAWLFTVVKNHALTLLRRQGRLVPADPAELERRREEDTGLAEELGIVEWITDRDLTLFVERLSLPQRQVLLLRYMLDMTDVQIARVLGRSREDVRALQHRALGFLRTRLEAVGRGPKEGKRAPMRSCPNQAFVLRERRFSLTR